MRKIIVTFNSNRKIQRLKKIMKDVYKNTLSDNLKLAKFNLGKSFIPNKVENVEIEISKIIGSNVTVVLPKTSLTFLSVHPPFDQVDASHDIEGNYIILPWNVTTSSGRNELKSLINKISASATSLKYTVNINTGDGKAGEPDTVSHGDFSLSDNSFEDNTEELFNRIRELEDSLRLANQNLQTANNETSMQRNLVQQKDQQISNLNNQIGRLNSQISSSSSQISSFNSQISNLNNQLSQKQSQISNLTSQVSSLQSTNNSYYNQITQMNNNQAYTMRLTNSRDIPGIDPYSLNFGAGGVLTFDKPINLTID